MFLVCFSLVYVLSKILLAVNNILQLSLSCVQIAFALSAIRFFIFNKLAPAILATSGGDCLGKVAVKCAVGVVFVAALCGHLFSSSLTFFSSDSSLTKTDARRSSSIRSQIRREADESRFFASACVHASKSAGIDTEVLVISLVFL